MKRLVLFLLLVLPVVLLAQKKDGKVDERAVMAKAVMEKACERCRSIKSGYYEMSVYRKHSGYHDDLHSYETKCYFDKNGGNSLWDYHFNIFTQYIDESWRNPFNTVYDGNKLLYSTANDKTVYDNPKSDKEKLALLELSLEVFLPFMNKENDMWELWLGGGYDFWLLGEKRVDNSLCYQILLSRNDKDRPKPTRDMGTNINEQCILWIDKETLLPLMYTEEWYVRSKEKGVVSFGYLKQKLNKFDENGFDKKQVDVSTKLL